MTDRPLRSRSAAAVVGVVALGLSALTTTAATAAPGPTDVVRSYAATPSTLGAIPDRPADGVVSKVVEIPVSGSTGTVSDVRLSLGLEHQYSADLSVVLVAPTGRSVDLVARDGDGSTYDDTSTFYDGAPGNLSDAADAAPTGERVPGGDYRPTDRVAGAPSSMQAEVGGTDANGTWRVRITDFSSDDTGLVVAATLTLATSLPRSETAACKNATSSAAAAQAAVTAATTSLTTAQAKLAKAKAAKKKASTPASKKKAAKKVKKAKAAVKAAQASLTAAQTALAQANAARTSSC